MRSIRFCLSLFVWCSCITPALAQDEDIIPKHLRSFMNGLAGSWTYEGSYGEQPIRGEWTVTWAPGNHCLVYRESGLIGKKGEESLEFTGSGTASYDPSTQEFVGVSHYSDGNCVTNRYAIPSVAKGDLAITGEQSMVKADGTKATGKIRWKFEGKNAQSFFSVIGDDEPIYLKFRRKQLSTPTQKVVGVWSRIDQDGKEMGAVKFIMSNCWSVTYPDPSTGLVQAHHGGTYTLEGPDYAETIRYANETTKDFIKKTFHFRVHVDGDTLTLKGTDNEFDEVWKRVK